MTNTLTATPLGELPQRGSPVQKRHYKWWMLLLLPLWVTVVWFVSNVIVYVALLPAESVLPSAILATINRTLWMSLAIGLLLGVPYVVRRRFTTDRSILGVDRRLSRSDIRPALATYFPMKVTAVAVLVALAALVPAFQAPQTQDVGFQPPVSVADSILAFLTIVVIVPLAEETLFRGYLYGKLKAHAPAVPAAFVTSLLFAIAHLQWYISIYAFVLSLFLCGLRSRTGSIWPGVLVHMINNGLATIVSMPLFGLPTWISVLVNLAVLLTGVVLLVVYGVRTLKKRRVNKEMDAVKSPELISVGVEPASGG